MSMKSLPVVLLLGLLAACATAAEKSGPPQRIVITFESVLALDDAALLRRLSTAAGGRVEFAGAAGSTAAAYLLQCPAADQDCEQSMAKLRQLDGVSGVQRDGRARAVPGA